MHTRFYDQTVYVLTIVVEIDSLKILDSDRCSLKQQARSQAERSRSGRTTPSPVAKTSTFRPTVWALTFWISSVYETELIKSSRLTT